MVSIKLPDGAVRQFDQPVSVEEVAAAIGPGLAKAALAGKVDGKVVDTSYVIDRDASLAIVTDKDPEGLDVIRHSTAHLLAYAVKELFPDAQVTIGPVIEDGFYYDFSYKRPVHARGPRGHREADGRAREEGRAGRAHGDAARRRGQVLRDAWASTTRPRSSRRSRATSTISLYREGGFIDLCRGPHVPSTGKLKVFKLMKVAGAYWRGDSKQRDAAADLRHRVGEEGGPRRVPHAHRGGGEARPPQARHASSTSSTCRTRRRAWCSGIPKGWSIWQQVEQYMRRVYQDNGYQEVRGAADPRPLAVGALGPLGELQGEHVHDGVGEARLRDQADELSRATCRSSTRTCAATATCRCATASSAQCHRNEPSGALHGIMRVRGVHAGRRPHLLHRRADPAASASRSTSWRSNVYKRLRLHRRRDQARAAPRQAARRRRDVGPRRGRAAQRAARMRRAMDRAARRGRVLRPEDRVPPEGLDRPARGSAARCRSTSRCPAGWAPSTSPTTTRARCRSCCTARSSARSSASSAS